MQTKLTLRLDDRLIEQAKAHARRTGKSVSQLVADYFALIEQTTDSHRIGVSARVSGLRGALKGSTRTEEDYRRHLEEKHR